MSYGFVYILSNKSMPDIYKIGYTDRSPMQRACELSQSTSIPTDFQIIAYGEVENASSIEAQFHESYERERISFNREFFKFAPDIVIYELCVNLQEVSDNFTKCQSYFELEHFVEGLAKNGRT